MASVKRVNAFEENETNATLHRHAYNTLNKRNFSMACIISSRSQNILTTSYIDMTKYIQVDRGG